MPGGKTLARILYAGAEIDPAATAVETFDSNITFKELIARVEATGGALRKLVSVPDGRIALCAGNCVDHLVAYLAILLSGFVWVPLNPANGRALNAKIAQKARPDLVLVDRASTEQAPDNDRLQQLETLKPGPRAFQATQVSPDDIAAIKFTGGTSGEPKGVVQTHGNMLACIENLQAFYEFDNTDCNLVVAPLTHGSSHYVFPILGAGGRHLFPKDRSPATILSAMQKGVTIAFMPPTLIYKLLQSKGLSPNQFGRLRHLTYSAAPMPPDRIAEAQRAFGPRVSSLYGQTEAPLTICALSTREMQDPVLRGKAGKACRNSEVRVVDESGKGLPAGDIGHIEVRGPIVMRGYLDEPGITAAAMHDGWLRTGDLGCLDDSGLLTLAGRASDVIITGGFNVYPAEIENVLARAPGVRECCVYGVDDPYWGERIEAVVVTEPGGETTGDEVLAFVREELGPVRTPKALHVADELPRNAVGKVVRREVREYLQTQQEVNDVESL
jgi:acyl-CoA synthetase (AMP-forming)/AMP-acid ligase II